jgi:hypothetical protein
LFASPRRRRRLLWAVAVLGVLGGALALALVFPNTGDDSGAGSPAGKAEAPPEPPEEPEPATVQLTPAARAAALKTAGDFIKTAVLRQRVDASWQLTAPSLRAGYTRKQWRTGDIPVVPYPVRSLASARWRVNHSYRDDVGLDVLLLPKRGSGLRPATFAIDLRAVGSARRKHWLVESWTPVGVPPPSLSPGQRRAAQAAGPEPLGAVWLLVPVAGLLLLLLIPCTVLLKGWRANRRAERAYRERLQLPEPRS